MNKHGFKVFKLEYEGETYFISAQTQEEAIQHLFVEHLEELNPTGILEANEFPEEKWEDFKIDFTHDIGEDDDGRLQPMSEFMFNVNEIQIVASSVFN